VIYILAASILAGVSWVQLQAELPSRSELGLATAGAVGLMVLWWSLGKFSKRASLATQHLRMFLLSLAITVIAAGFATYSAEDALRERLKSHLDRRSVWLDLTVVDLPTRDDRSWRFEVEINHAYEDATEQSLIRDFPTRGVVHWYFSDRFAAPDQLGPGERWKLQVRLRQPQGSRNPAGFDYEAWMLEKRLSFGGTVQQSRLLPAPERVGSSTGVQIRIDQWRDAIRKRIDHELADEPSRHVIAALVVGDQRAISTEEWSIFQRSGVSHLMSISGLHVTMLAALVGWLGGRLWQLLCSTPARVGLILPVQSVTALCAILGAIGYALLAGFAIPAQRTALMVTVVCFARLFGVRANPWASLSIALMTVVLWDPLSVLAPGFWLSFLAVAFLFVRCSDTVEQADSSWLRKIVSVLRQAGQAQLAITFGLLPITVLFFQQVVLIGPLANAVAIPVVSYLVTPLAMLGVVIDGLFSAPFFLRSAAAIQNWLYGCLVWAAQHSFATIDWPSPGLWRTIGASVGMVIALGNILPQALSHYRHLGWCALGLLIGVAPAPPAVGDMEVTIIDVGQGSSVLIRTHSKSLLYDTGPVMGRSDAGARMVMPTLRRFNIHALDEVMVSHLDQDHSGGLASVLALMPVHRLRTSDPDSLLVTSTPVNPQLEPSACVAGQHWQWDGVWFEVLHPSPQWLAGVVKTKKPDRNAASCVLRVAAQNGGSLLLTGDITAVVEGGLHDYGASLASEVLVAAHHGSKTSTSSGFLAQVAPALTVIQAGYRNRYGHPHPEVLERLREVSALARTDLQGAIELRWRSGARTISDFWSAHRRYWHLERYSE